MVGPLSDSRETQAEREVRRHDQKVDYHSSDHWWWQAFHEEGGGVYL